MHAGTSGVAHFTVSDRNEADDLIAELLGYLPDQPTWPLRVGHAPTRWTALLRRRET
ncbi:MAG: hypothetical protein CM1200mP26_23070 [Acidimicrobiales bacterium]|nr:MAG: hypothetical protein CM1200mP26_23070 [Acidimicrobiales bacterium]